MTVLLLVALCVASLFLPWINASITSNGYVGEPASTLFDGALPLTTLNIPYLDSILVLGMFCVCYTIICVFRSEKRSLRMLGVLIPLIAAALITVYLVFDHTAFDLLVSAYSDSESILSVSSDALLKQSLQLESSVGIGIIVLPICAVWFGFSCFKAAADEKAVSKQPDIKKLCVCAMLIAVGVVLSGALVIPDFSMGGYSMKIGFGALIPILVGVLYGPSYGAMAGALVDLLQALLFPKGAFVPWFTIVAAFSGLIPGLFFIKRNHAPGIVHILLATLAGQFICSVVMNTALLTWLYNMPWWSLVGKRAINQAIMIPMYTVIIWFIVKLLARTGFLNKFTDYKTVPRGSSSKESIEKTSEAKENN